MAIYGVNQISAEQLMAMSMMSNGQLTSDSSSTTSNTSGDTNLAFELMMKNLMSASNNSKGSLNTELVDNKVVQQNATGKNLEDIVMVLNNFNRIDNTASTISNRSGADRENIYSAVEAASKKYGVDQNLILAIIKQESNFDSGAVSSVGATGLMQLMPENFSYTGVSNPYDINENIDGGTKLLKEYLDKYKGDIEMALMAYNGGPGTMQKRGVSSSNDLYKMPEETQNYVPSVLRYYKSGV